MSESETTSTGADLQALETLRADARELERIEGLLDRFNVFEAIGFVGQEIKHSRFLAFLLDPGQNHGLGHYFLKRLLREALASAHKAPLPRNVFDDFGRTDLDQTLVQTERHNIDVLLMNEAHRQSLKGVYESDWKGSVELEGPYNSVKGFWPLFSTIIPIA